MRVYQAGAINGCSDAVATGFRREMQQRLQSGVTWVDPMARDYRGKEEGKSAEIVEPDLAEIQTCDLVLADCSQKGWGTAMEIAYAAAVFGLPVVAYVPFGQSVSPWIDYHAKKVLRSALEAESAVGYFAATGKLPTGV